MRIRLKDAFDLQMVKTPARNTPSYWDGDHKWISIADIGSAGKYIATTKERITDKAITESGIRAVPAHTVIMSFKLSIGKTAITSEEMYTNEAIMAFISNGTYAIDTDYLYHLCCGTAWTEGTNKAVMGLTLNKATLSKKRISLPEITEQRNIAAKFDALDNVIEKTQSELSSLDQLVKSRFVEMFGLPGTDAHGWGMSSLGEICEINPKKSQDARLTNGLLVSFVSMPSVSESGDIDTTQVKPYDEVKTGFTYFAENDVLFAKITPCMENGKGAVATGLYNGIGFGSTEFHVLRPAKETATPCWIYTLTVFPQFRIDAASNMTGSAGQRRVPASFLENYRVSVPPLELQNRFAAFVAEVDKSKFRIQKSLSTSRKLWTMAQIDAIMNMDFSTQRSL